MQVNAGIGLKVRSQRSNPQVKAKTVSIDNF
jgi:hypothetical protein